MPLGHDARQVIVVVWSHLRGAKNTRAPIWRLGSAIGDDHWRYQSPSRIARFYGNLGWKGSDSEVRLVASEAKNFFGVSHP